LGAQEAIAAGDLLGEGRDEALAIDLQTELGVDAVQDFGDMERGAGFLEYVVGHVHLRQTFTVAWFGGVIRALTETADGAQLCL
jgi:hypothetical protein